MIRIDLFKGAVPALAPRAAGDPSIAEYAVNSHVRSGQLKGWRAPVEVHTFAPEVTVAKGVRLKKSTTGAYLWYPLASAKDEVISSPLVNDAYNRFYLFRPSQPPQVATWDQINAGTGFANLTVPAPAAKPTAVVGGASTQPLLAETRAYVTSYITEWGEESNISRPRLVTVEPTQTVTLSDLYPSLGTLAGRSFAYVRIYRTVVGANTVDYYRVTDLAWGTTSFVDDLPSTEVALNTILSTQNDNLPSGFWGARVHPSGALMAFKGRVLRFSVPYLPHAWPDDYQLAFKDSIVAVEVFMQNIIVFTDGGVYLVYGSEPGQMGITMFPDPTPCLGYNTVVPTDSGVYFITTDGLAVVSTAAPKVFSQQLIQRDQWRRGYAGDLSACFHDGFYLALDDTGRGFSIDLTQGTLFGELAFSDGLVFAKDVYNGVTYATRGQKVYEYDPQEGPRVPYQWRSKEFYSSRPVGYEAIEVDFDHLPIEAISTDTGVTVNVPDERSQVLVHVYADGELIFSQVANRVEPLALPRGKKYRIWQVEVLGYCPLHYVALAETTAGLANV